MVPGEKFSTITSAQRISGSRTSRLSARFMSSARLRLEVLRCANHGLSSKLPAFEALTWTSSRVRHGRVRLSTLITSAPKSPSVLVVIDPTNAQEKSRTRTPARGPGPVCRESVAAMLAVAPAPRAACTDMNRPGTCVRSGRTFQNSRSARCAIAQHVRGFRNDSRVDATSVALLRNVLFGPCAEKCLDRMFPRGPGLRRPVWSGCRISNRPRAKGCGTPCSSIQSLRARLAGAPKRPVISV